MSQDEKKAAYKGRIRPRLKYGNCVWEPLGLVHEEIENVQNRAARFVTSKYCFETRSMTVKLRWESLKKTRRDGD